MSDRSTDSGDLSPSCSFYSVESNQLEVSELDNTPETIEPYDMVQSFQERYQVLTLNGLHKKMSCQYTFLIRP